MDSGRSTPVALTTPLIRPLVIPDIFVEDTTSVPGQQEQQIPIQAQLPPPPPPHPPPNNIGSVRSHPGTGQSSGTPDLILCCLFTPIITPWLGNFSAFRSTIAAVFCLGWAVYSRAFRMELKTLITTLECCKHCIDGEPVPSYYVRSLGEVKTNDRPHRALDGPLKVETRPKTVIDCRASEAPSPISPLSPTDVPSPRQLQPNSEARFKDQAFATHALLRKHYKYLLPWVSKQPETPVEEQNMNSASASSEIRMADEFRRMSLSHFAELSTAVYRDVRRRDEEASPATPQPPQPEPWLRNKQNESRMVLCRAINEQYHRLVMTVVLEQARRLAEIRIRIHRRNLVVKE